MRLRGFTAKAVTTAYLIRYAVSYFRIYTAYLFRKEGKIPQIGGIVYAMLIRTYPLNRISYVIFLRYGSGNSLIHGSGTGDSYLSRGSGDSGDRVGRSWCSTVAPESAHDHRGFSR
jgi:hypothetical protein